MPLGLLPFILLIIPMLEIGAFIVIGQQIGIAATLAMIVVTAVIGSFLLRMQGFGLLARIQQETAAGRVPGRELVHGVMILVAGVLLLTPGFITDTLGFLLFIPALRDAAWHFLKDRVTVTTFGMPGGEDVRRDAPFNGRDGGPTIDLEEDEFRDETPRASPWNDRGT
ncbi:MAG: membrane protein FxsA [Notoacmeibacter sp.]|nr:membrane protein FxsA [Notoacmeibacter sp.]MCC0033525.1 membrane protein FxsA [Brucellaceae bacterium]